MVMYKRKVGLYAKISNIFARSDLMLRGHNKFLYFFTIVKMIVFFLFFIFYFFIFIFFINLIIGGWRDVVFGNTKKYQLVEV